ncbi:ABC transporter permease [Acidisphaera rubrifaciens]|uniref:ABC transporter monosaccharide permease n=1 Tax=Acidisphaera rubrifaciens HS-AP3 TaxID=1231350 RepID=A0A0D6P631_9PROT|nr:ABC transporter permease [Acidisphaera rubrifaciens]GAN76653.1 ABC transporter monosaccharide permease [Acidisphaera rubrifaciens HS-AP3]
MSLSQTGTPDAPRRRSLLRLLATEIELRMLLLIVLVMAVLSLISPYFLTVNNLLNVLDQSVVVGMVALGQTLVILIGGIDLSVGSLAGATGIILGLALPKLGLAGGIAACLAAGALAGLVNGAIITFGRVAPFVVTLGMMSIARSLAYIFSGANSISDLPAALGALSSDTLAGKPVDFWCLLVAYAVCWWFLAYTKGGRTLYAVGSNAEAARVAGLGIATWSVFAYVVSGAMSAVAAIFLASRILSIDPIGGQGLELDAIAAVVIGGASLFGGRGSIIGTLCGVFVMVFIRNGLNLLNVSPYWQGTAIGSIIIAAVLAERLLSRARPGR